ncbi:hypothetical protein SanaruYs_09350 [Chryseotalea sanaruensis]|uniref:Gingipain domain-containing protein n=2 Tax=Chryseotalea sanaruensis TaxID=2482724 RepID=A0A401U756_9BACT|nr:hypothetical protein SanaruYs_09350 [Chryseotalea sanaruensis]
MVETIYGQSSVLSEGTWLKIPVSKTGVYKITHAQLRDAGVDIDQVDPRTIKIYTNPGGMLPQSNATDRPIDLIESSIIVQGESDGVFNNSDLILFYAQGPNQHSYNLSKQVFYYEYNLYADKNYAFLTFGGESGKRIHGADSPEATVDVNEYQDVLHHELTRTNILESGREWYGERFENNVEQSINLNIEGIVAGSTIKFVSDVVAYSLAGSAFAVKINDQEVGIQSIDQVPNSQYGLKARHKRDTFLLNATNVNAVNRTAQRITYRFTKNGNAGAYGHLDFFNLHVTRKLAVYNDQVSFRSAQSLNQQASQFILENGNSNTQVWDVTTPASIASYTVQLVGNTASFTANTTILREFFAFNQALNAEAPVRIQNQNLRGSASLNLLIVTDEELKIEAMRLADHRTTHSGIVVNVVTVDQIYNEFSGGRPDVTAIRDYARLLSDKYPQAFQSLLLFGKGTYDYKNTLPNNKNRVFTYTSRNSLSPLETYSSDDYYGLLEAHEGEWRECFSCNETLDIAVGRLPIKESVQAKYIVDKIITYETKEEGQSGWQNRIAFVADDGDFNVHHAQADLLAAQVENINNSVFNAEKLYIDNYAQISRPAGQIAPEANIAIENIFDKGALIINYTGHGNEYQWAQEKVFDELMILDLKNESLPFLVTATCEFGRHDDVQVSSAAEVILLREKYGAIGLVTTARPVNSSTNFDLNKAFYEAFLQKENGRFRTLGEIFKDTKNNSSSGVANRNFSLLGDPSMHLAAPQSSIKIESITTDQDVSTLQALARVTVKGYVEGSPDQADENFNGLLEASVYDKAGTLRTLGDENPPFNYKQWSSLLFRGQASVESGVFEFNFIVPKNIAYALGDGRMSLFAKDGNKAAAGVSSIEVGGSATISGNDIEAPQLTAFMNDATFVNGGIVSADSRLVVRISDESGITISNYGIGNDLVAVLDDEAIYELGDYFLADINDFTKGTVVFPLRDIKPGKHRLRVMAWDTYNNPGEATVDFVVTDGTAMVIEEFGNYPNPFSIESTLFFTHNTAGEDVSAQIVVYSPQGDQILSETIFSENSAFRVDLATIKRNDLKAGVYIAKLFLRSQTSGKRASAQAKLIILN